MSNDGLLRKVWLKVDQKTATILRTFKGWETFNPQTECMFIVRPIWGLKDAPRLFTLKLAQVMKACKYEPNCTDKKLYMKHVAGKCVSLAGGHMDDLKGASSEKERLLLTKSLEDIFGTCTKKLGTFMYLGVQHEQSSDKRTIYKHQRHYVAELHPITIDAHKIKDIEKDLDELEISLLRSLLGALAWLTQTRPEIHVFVGFVQRSVKKLQVRHAVLLNTCLKWVRKHPSGIFVKHISGHTAFYCVADSAFSAEEPDCLAIRADIIGMSSYSEQKIGGTLHVWVATSKKQSRVVRNTFAAEAGALGDSGSMAIVLAGMQHEIDMGPQTPAQLEYLAENGGFSRRIVIFTDSNSVYAAVTATEVQLPKEKHLAYTVMKIREWLDKRVIHEIVWIDTRSMVCDGLTKGSVNRFDLIKLLNTGTWNCEQADTAKRWKPKHA